MDLFQQKAILLFLCVHIALLLNRKSRSSILLKPKGRNTQKWKILFLTTL